MRPRRALRVAAALLLAVACFFSGDFAAYATATPTVTVTTTETADPAPAEGFDDAGAKAVGLALALLVFLVAAGFTRSFSQGTKA